MQDKIMATVNSGIARHYDVSVGGQIAAALADIGVDVAHLRAGDLEAVDEFTLAVSPRPGNSSTG